jgi:hypothetical protein
MGGSGGMMVLAEFDYRGREKKCLPRTVSIL